MFSAPRVEEQRHNRHSEGDGDAEEVNDASHELREVRPARRRHEPPINDGRRGLHGLGARQPRDDPHGHPAGALPAPEQPRRCEEQVAMADAGHHLALVRELLHERHRPVVRHQQLRRAAAGDDDAVEVVGAGVRPVRRHHEVVAPPLLAHRDRRRAGGVVDRRHDGLALALGRARGFDTAAHARQRPERHVRLVVVDVVLQVRPYGQSPISGGATSGRRTIKATSSRVA